MGNRGGRVQRSCSSEHGRAEDQRQCPQRVGILVHQILLLVSSRQPPDVVLARPIRRRVGGGCVLLISKATGVPDWHVL